MGSTALYSVPLTRALTIASGHPYTHIQLNLNRGRLSISSRLRSTSFHALPPPASIGGGRGGGGIQTSRFGGGGGDGGSDSEILIKSAAAVGIADEILDADAEEFIILDVTVRNCCLS